MARQGLKVLRISAVPYRGMALQDSQDRAPVLTMEGTEGRFVHTRLHLRLCRPQDEPVTPDIVILGVRLTGSLSPKQSHLQMVGARMMQAEEVGQHTWA